MKIANLLSMFTSIVYLVLLPTAAGQLNCDPYNKGGTSNTTALKDDGTSVSVCKFTGYGGRGSTSLTPGTQGNALGEAVLAFYNDWVDTDTFNAAEVQYGPIEYWDVSETTNMFGLLYLLGNGFNPDISRWDVSSVTFFGRMFEGATDFNRNVGAWDVVKGRVFDYMFKGAESFNESISGWDVSNGLLFDYMFFNATDFNQDISGWAISCVDCCSFMHYNSGITAENANDCDPFRPTFAPTITQAPFSQAPTITPSATISPAPITTPPPIRVTLKITQQFSGSCVDSEGGQQLCKPLLEDDNFSIKLCEVNSCTTPTGRLRHLQTGDTYLSFTFDCDSGQCTENDFNDLQATLNGLGTDIGLVAVGNMEVIDIDEVPSVSPTGVHDVCPCDEDWRNHGKYVVCTVRYYQGQIDTGLITEDELDDLVSIAADSDCGKNII